MWIYPWLPVDYNIPPTLYSIMNSLANFDSEEQTKIKDLASVTRTEIFDFTYPLSTHVNKEDFEVMILNHFIMRRIGYNTMTAFKIALNVKLNEIMPMYNKLFDALNGWNLFTDGEVITTSYNESGNTSASSQSLSTTDNRYSDTPQGRLADVQNGSYMTDYTFNQGSGSVSSSGTDSRAKQEIKSKTPSDKMKLYREFIENRQSIMTMIFKDLDPLFYGLA